MAAGEPPTPWPDRGSAPPGPDPRLLVIDSTRIGALSATGHLKRTLLRGWDRDRIMQIWTPQYGSVAVAAGSHAEGAVGSDELMRTIEEFDPEVVYYRPTIDRDHDLHAAAEGVLSARSTPLVTHIVDDWPLRLAASDAEAGEAASVALRRLISRSSCCLSVSEAMSEEMERRFDAPFEAIANGVDVERYRRASASAAGGRRGDSEVLFRYCGALAPDMNFDTILAVARAVEAVSRERPARLEIYTMPIWRRAFEQALADARAASDPGCGSAAVSVFDSVADDEYPALLAESDVLVLGYNFDPGSLRYVRYSMPNKLPEYLGSGAAVLAVGPRQANGIDYLLSRGLASCVTDSNPAATVEAVRRLAADAESRSKLGAEGQAWAFEHLDANRSAERFQARLRHAAAAPARIDAYERLDAAAVETLRRADRSRAVCSRSPQSRYDRLYLWARNRSPAMFLAGRFLMRLARWLRGLTRGELTLARRDGSGDGGDEGADTLNRDGRRTG